MNRRFGKLCLLDEDVVVGDLLGDVVDDESDDPGDSLRHRGSELRQNLAPVLV